VARACLIDGDSTVSIVKVNISRHQYAL